MNLSIFDPVVQVNQKILVIDEASLYKAFEHVKDGRKEKGKRYPLPLILTLIPASEKWPERPRSVGSLIG
jgi:hypothetical protein